MANFPEPPNDPILDPETLPAPLRDALKGARFNFAWIEWLLKFRGRVNQTTQTVKRSTFSGQAAALGVTALGVVSGDLCRVTWFARIVQAAAVSSSLIVTIGFTDGAVACTFDGAALTANVTNAVQSGSVLVRRDGGSVVTASTTYASVGAPVMKWDLEVILEAVTQQAAA